MLQTKVASSAFCSTAIGVSQQVEGVVIGAGVIGLAVARAIALSGKEVLVIEKNSQIGMETSSRNSEVIHAGLYYSPNSWKARCCIQGKQALYEYCKQKDIPHKRLGKILVASTESERETLNTILHNANSSGVNDLQMLERSNVRNMESEVECVAGLYSPSTGIVDTHSLMLALQGDAENAGTQFIFNSQFVGGQINNTTGKKQLKIYDNQAQEEVNLECNWLVNAGGLTSWEVARAIEGYNQSSIPPKFLAKGSYVDYSGDVPFKHLIYPVPKQGALGIHLTLDTAGKARFGPDLEWTDSVGDYDVQPSKVEPFFQSVRKFWPGICKERMHVSYAGIRPRVVGKGRPEPDFMIQGEEFHKVPGMINFFGIESPGLTSCLSIAERVLRLLQNQQG